MCLSAASLPPVPLCLSSSVSLDDLYLTFHIHLISGKGFWGSLWSRSFSSIKKPEASETKEFLSNYACLSGKEGTKLLPLLNILKNSLSLRVGKNQASWTPANSLNPSDSSDGTKTSFPIRGTTQDFYQLICPWCQSQFEHDLVYILAIELWLQKGKMTFWHRSTMIFFRLRRKLVKMKLFFYCKLQNYFFLRMQLKTTSLLKSLPREKLEVNLFHSWESLGMKGDPTSAS